MSFKPYSRRLAMIYDLVYRKAMSSKTELDFIEHVFKKYVDIEIEHVLDLAAGTGGQTIWLAQKGYKVVAQDASPEMLAILESKAEAHHLSEQISCVARRMEDTEAVKAFDAAIAVYRSVNHLVDEGLPEWTFRSIFRALKPGGVFIFDTANFFAMSTHLHQDTQEVIDGEDFFVIRHSHPEPKDLENVWVNHEVLRFMSENGEQWAEHVISELRHFTPAELRTYLKLAGFSAIHQFAGYGSVYDPPHEDPASLVTVAIK